MLPKVGSRWASDSRHIVHPCVITVKSIQRIGAVHFINFTYDDNGAEGSMTHRQWGISLLQPVKNGLEKARDKIKG